MLVSASPKRLAGDVGALRGVANNVSNALGAAFASVVAVGLLGVFLGSAYTRSHLPVDFVTDTELRGALAVTSPSPQLVDRAIAENRDARLRALRASFLIVGAISLLALFPAWRLPRYVPEELSADELVSERQSQPGRGA